MSNKAQGRRGKHDAAKGKYTKQRIKTANNKARQSARRKRITAERVASGIKPYRKHVKANSGNKR